MRNVVAPALALLLFVGGLEGAAPAAVPEAGAAEKPPAVKDLNSPRTFPIIESREAWQARAKDIREQVLVSCGLWPMPEKTPLEPQIWGTINCGSYSVQKVYFQPLPGFYLGGNLYRPLRRGEVRFPPCSIRMGTGRQAGSRTTSRPAWRPVASVSRARG